MSEHTADINAETTVPKYQNDKDFDESFKNLLSPIETIAKKTYSDPFQYNLQKELDSYLNHLKKSSNIDSSVFVEAALMMQNVNLIYQQKIDRYVDKMTSIAAKIRAYRSNLNGTGNNLEIEDRSKRSKKEKNAELYNSFVPLKIELKEPIKNVDYKSIDLSKKRRPKIVLNSNIKVNNKSNQLLPDILTENGEHFGKKYDFLLSNPLNCDLSVDLDLDYFTNEEFDTVSPNCHNDQNNSVPSPMLMDVDVVNPDDTHLPNPINFDQTVNDAPLTAALPSANMINTSQIPQITDDCAWSMVVDDNAYSDIPIMEQKTIKKKREDENMLPSYTMSEIFSQEFKLKQGIDSDQAFRKIIYDAQKTIRSQVAMKEIERIEDDSLDSSMKYEGSDHGNFDYNFNDDCKDQEKLSTAEGGGADYLQGYEKTELDYQIHGQKKLKIMNEHLEMRKRVEKWHDNLKPILEAEEKSDEFDIHAYGTKVLNCFDEIGEQKSFKDLAGGLVKEEVARYYVSTLMMANTNNVKLINVADDPDGDIKIELLNKERHHEQLQVNIGNQVNQDLK